MCCILAPGYGPYNTPGDVAKWVDEQDGVGQTALCPKCGIDSVIGSSSGYPITQAFLSGMRRYWFE